MRKFNFVRESVDCAIAANTMADSISEFRRQGGEFIQCVSQTSLGVVGHRPTETLLKQGNFEQFHTARVSEPVVREHYGLLRMQAYQRAKRLMGVGHA